MKASKEKILEDIFCADIDRRGVQYSRQYKCKKGRIDILTESTIYELKYELNRYNIQTAIGQLLIYKLNFTKEYKLAIVTAKIAENFQRDYLDITEPFNIMVICLSENSFPF